jgi:hypothetical protein
MFLKKYGKMFCTCPNSNNTATNQMSDISAYAHSWLPLLPFVNIDKTNTENDSARAFAYLENKYTFILIIMI